MPSARRHAQARTFTQTYALTNKQHTQTHAHVYSHYITRLHTHTLRTRTHADTHERNVLESLHACTPEPPLTRAPLITMLSYAYVFVLVLSVRHLLHHGELGLQAHQLRTSMRSSLRFIFLPLDNLLETLFFLFQSRDKANIHMCSNDDQKRAR